MTPEEKLEHMRAMLVQQDRVMLRLKRNMQICTLLHVLMAAWFASRLVYQADTFSILLLAFNAIAALVTIRVGARRWAEWLALRDRIVRDLFPTE